MKAGIKIALVLLLGGVILTCGIFGYKLYQKYLAISGSVELLEMAHNKTKSLKSKKKLSKKLAHQAPSKSPSNWRQVLVQFV